MFGNMTYKLTPRIDVSGGARYAKNTETNCVETGGAFGAGLVPCTSRPYDDVTTWMANSRFHLSRDSTIYLRVATGYRPGAGCESCGLPALGIPGIYQPDSLINYEVGFKSDLLDHRAQLDFSAFHIDWKDIQLQQSSPEGLLFIVNGSTAVSDGIELTTSYQLVPGMRLGATLGYTDAHLTQDAPPGADGKNGDQLPLSARWTGSITADYNRPLGAETTLLVGGGYRYRDSMNAMFESSATPEPMPPQSIVDLYGGLGVRNLSARLYVKNVFNNRSYGGFFTQRDPQRPLFSPVQPRTTGLSLDYQF